jgi:hypothetical protein
MDVTQFFEDLLFRMNNRLGYTIDEYIFGKSGSELTDLYVSVSFALNTHHKSLSQFLVVDDVDMKYDIQDFMNKNYHHLKSHNTQHMNSLAIHVESTFLQCCLLIEYCIINLYKTGYFTITVDKVHTAFINNINYCAKRDLRQLLEQGGYATMVKGFINHMQEATLFNYYYCVDDEELFLTTKQFTQELMHHRVPTKSKLILSDLSYYQLQTIHDAIKSYKII